MPQPTPQPTTDYYLQIEKLKASGSTSVAVDGDAVMVGACYDDERGSESGAVFIFRASHGNDTYVEVTKLTGRDTASYDNFGYSMAKDGSTVVVGVPKDSDGGTSSGAVYVFRTTDGGDSYSQVVKLVASDASAYDNFGHSVAISGGTIVAGAIGDDDGGSNSGAAYIFRTSDGGITYTEINKLTASDAASGGSFGYAVAIDGSVVTIGTLSKAVHVFRLDDGGATHVELDKLTGGYSFGRSVAVDGATVVVGDSDEDGTAGSGAVYIFRPSVGDAYIEVARLTADDAAGMHRNYFGISVAASGNVVVVGASYALSHMGHTGAVYVFRAVNGDATYARVATLMADDAVIRFTRSAGTTAPQPQAGSTAARNYKPNVFGNWDA